MRRTCGRTLMVSIVSVGLCLVSGCATSTGSDTNCSTDMAQELPIHSAGIHHMVFLKLKDPSESEALMHDCRTRLSTIPGVVSSFCGQHVDAGRPNVDESYDVGFYVGFASVDTYLGFVEHPDHLAVVARWRDRLEWMRVYDVRSDFDRFRIP